MTFFQIHEDTTHRWFFIFQNFTTFFTKRVTWWLFDYYFIISKEKVRKCSSQWVRSRNILHNIFVNEIIKDQDSSKFRGGKTIPNMVLRFAYLFKKNLQKMIYNQLSLNSHFKINFINFKQAVFYLMTKHFIYQTYKSIHIDFHIKLNESQVFYLYKL